MTEQQKKSRRRFLADLLFMGGGLTAAAMLARSVTQEAPDPNATATPQPTASPAEPPPQVDGEMMIPEGRMTVPEDPPVFMGEMEAPQPTQPTPKGKVAMPQHQVPTEIQSLGNAIQAKPE